MSAEILLEALTEVGIVVQVDGEKLVCRPKGKLTDELRAAIREHKRELIRLLGNEREGPPYPDGLGCVKCFYCSKLELTGCKALCRISGKSMSGIALLIECSDFVMTTVH